jgi:hypothetical protein
MKTVTEYEKEIQKLELKLEQRVANQYLVDRWAGQADRLFNALSHISVLLDSKEVSNEKISTFIKEVFERVKKDGILETAFMCKEFPQLYKKDAFFSSSESRKVLREAKKEMEAA